MPPIAERIDRFESAVRVIRALDSPAATTEAGVTLDDPFYPLRGAVNLPPPLTPGGPPIWLGGQGPRGLGMAAGLADGLAAAGGRPSRTTWPTSPSAGGDPGRAGRRSAAIRPASSFAAQVPTGRDADRAAAEAGELAAAFAAAGDDHVILGMPARLGPDGLRIVAHEIAEPLREALG